MDPPKTRNRKALRAQERRRAQLAALPFPEKVRAVVQMQQMVASLLQARGKKVRIWNLGD